VVRSSTLLRGSNHAAVSSVAELPVFKLSPSDRGGVETKRDNLHTRLQTYWGPVPRIGGGAPPRKSSQRGDGARLLIGFGSKGPGGFNSHDFRGTRG
jgi:hypothetical protein